VSVFQFQQFIIKQADSAMKVGTDAVILGSSTPLSTSIKSILDIGSGTGVLSLMMAQRATKTQITAIEIDEAAAEESYYNFKNSPFSNRLRSLHTSLDSYLSMSSSTFDLIVCNPPFFEDSQAEGSRKKARDSKTLPAEELFKAVNQLLKNEGQFSLITPYLDEEKIIKIASQQDLYPFQVLRVRGRKKSKIVRSVLHFKRGSQNLVSNELFIELYNRHEYSNEYLKLVEDFLYLKK